VQRSVTKVLEDVRDGYISIAGALRDYAVIIQGDPDRDPEGLVVDEAGTRAARAARQTPP
jgi:N-methylhydantoinase B